MKKLVEEFLKNPQLKKLKEEFPPYSISNFLEDAMNSYNASSVRKVSTDKRVSFISPRPDIVIEGYTKQEVEEIEALWYKYYDNCISDFIKKIERANVSKNGLKWKTIGYMSYWCDLKLETTDDSEIEGVVNFLKEYFDKYTDYSLTVGFTDTKGTLKCSMI